MEHLLEAAAEYFVFTIIGSCFAFGMLLRAITTTLTTSARERSRREIAAYIAEGSISAEQGERLMRADAGGQMNRAA